VCHQRTWLLGSMSKMKVQLIPYRPFNIRPTFMR
jgi:hypothetical protein